MIYFLAYVAVAIAVGMVVTYVVAHEGLRDYRPDLLDYIVYGAIGVSIGLGWIFIIPMVLLGLLVRWAIEGKKPWEGARNVLGRRVSSRRSGSRGKS